jgi:predicted RNA-binding protein
MAYWLLVTTEDNWIVLKKNNVWGVTSKDKNILQKMKIGEKCIIYIKQKLVVVAIYEVESKMFRDTIRIFNPIHTNDNEVFPFRLKFKPIIIFKEQILFRPLVNQLSFIKNKRMWGSHLLGRAIREIPENDFKYISSNVNIK